MSDTVDILRSAFYLAGTIAASFWVVFGGYKCRRPHDDDQDRP